MAQTDAPSAPSDETAPSQFFNFDAREILGQRKRPTAAFIMGQSAAVKHARLLKLKRQVLPLLRATAKDATFR